MSQNSLTLPTTGTVSGLQMAQYINNALDTLNTVASGASAPGSPEAGQLWHNTATGQICLRDQANSTWMALFAVDEANKFAQPQNPASGMAPSPQGALTFTSNTPVMTADATAQATIYYTPYVGDCLPVYTGGYLAAIAFSQMALPLNAANHLAGSIYDVFAFMGSGALMLGAGPAWTNATTRAATLEQVRGIWLNAGAITLTSGASSYSGVGVNAAVYLGSFYCTANGQSGINFKPAGAAGGSANVVGLWNAYHRKRLFSLCRDLNVNYTCNSSAWREMDASAANRITWLDGLGQSAVRASVATTAQFTISNSAYAIGANLNGTAGLPGVVAEATPAVSGSYSLLANENFAPLMGLNYVQAMENSGYATNITVNSNGGAQYLMLDGEY